MNVTNNFTQNLFNRNASFFFLFKIRKRPSKQVFHLQGKMMWWSSLFQIHTGYSYTQTNFLFQVVSIGTENENNRLISTALAVSCLFSLSKFARGGAGLLLLFRRPFRLRLLYRQKQNQCVRLFKDESIKIEKTKTNTY